MSHLAVDDAELEGEFRVVLDPGRKRLGQRNRIAAGVSHRGNALETLQCGFNLGSLRRARGQLVLDDVVAAARPANRLAQLEILRRRQSGECADDGRGGALELLRQLCRPSPPSLLWSVPLTRILAGRPAAVL